MVKKKKKKLNKFKHLKLYRKEYLNFSKRKDFIESKVFKKKLANRFLSRYSRIFLGKKLTKLKLKVIKKRRANKKVVVKILLLKKKIISLKKKFFKRKKLYEIYKTRFFRLGKLLESSRSLNKKRLIIKLKKKHSALLLIKKKMKKFLKLLFKIKNKIRKLQIELEKKKLKNKLIYFQLLVVKRKLNNFKFSKSKIFKNNLTLLVNKLKIKIIRNFRLLKLRGTKQLKFLKIIKPIFVKKIRKKLFYNKTNYSNNNRYRYRQYKNFRVNNSRTTRYKRYYTPEQRKRYKRKKTLNSLNKFFGRWRYFFRKKLKRKYFLKKFLLKRKWYSNIKKSSKGTAIRLGRALYKFRKKREFFKKSRMVGMASSKTNITLFKVSYQMLLNYHVPFGKREGEWNPGVQLTNIMFIRNQMSIFNITDIFFELRKSVNRLFKSLKLRKGIAVLNGRNFNWKKLFTFVFDKWLPGFFTNFWLNINELVSYIVKYRCLTRRQKTRSNSLKLLNFDGKFLDFNYKEEYNIVNLISYIKLPSISLALTDNVTWSRECLKEGIITVQLADASTAIEKINYPLIANQSSIPFLSFITLLFKEIAYQARYWEIKTFNFKTKNFVKFKLKESKEGIAMSNFLKLRYQLIKYRISLLKLKANRILKTKIGKLRKIIKLRLKRKMKKNLKFLVRCLVFKHKKAIISRKLNSIIKKKKKKNKLLSKKRWSEYEIFNKILNAKLAKKKIIKTFKFGKKKLKISGHNIN